jgi:transposase
MEPIHKRVAGLDVHRLKHVVTVLIEEQDGTLTKVTRQFGGFKRDRREAGGWLGEHRVERVVMQSTGIYCKSVYASLSATGIPALVVNARPVKNVPGRKTDVADSEWLAQLARFGLMRGSFIPPKDLRALRLVSRYRRKPSGMLAGEKNRLHKLLDDAGIKLGGVVADIDGVSASRMGEGLIAGKSPGELAPLGRGPLKDKREELEASMQSELSPRHRLILEAAHRPIRDQISAPMILIEISDDLTRFGTADRLASWAELCPGNHESAGKRKSGKTRHGNPIVRYLLCEVANAARRTKSVSRAKYDSLVLRRGHKKPSSLLRINCCEPSSSCSPAANRIGIPGLITRRPAWRKTLPAGSEHRRSSATGLPSSRRPEPDRKASFLILFTGGLRSSKLRDVFTVTHQA